jgi:putative flippase GtrA
VSSPAAPEAGQPKSPVALRQFVRFLGVGALNTAFGYLLFAAFVFLGLASGLALALATVMGVAFNFLTTGRLVFANSDHRRLPRYLAVYGVQFLLNWSLLHALEQSMSPLLAQLILAGPMAVLTYLLMAKLVFGVQRPGKRQGSRL